MDNFSEVCVFIEKASSSSSSFFYRLRMCKTANCTQHSELEKQKLYDENKTPVNFMSEYGRIYKRDEFNKRRKKKKTRNIFLSTVKGSLIEVKVKLALS